MTQNPLRRLRINLFLCDQNRSQRVAECMKSSSIPVRGVNDAVLNEPGPNVVFYKLAS